MGSGSVYLMVQRWPGGEDQRGGEGKVLEQKTEGKFLHISRGRLFYCEGYSTRGVAGIIGGGGLRGGIYIGSDRGGQESFVIEDYRTEVEH